LETPAEAEHEERRAAHLEHERGGGPDGRHAHVALAAQHTVEHAAQEGDGGAAEEDAREERRARVHRAARAHRAKERRRGHLRDQARSAWRPASSPRKHLCFTRGCCKDRGSPPHRARTLAASPSATCATTSSRARPMARASDAGSPSAIPTRALNVRSRRSPRRPPRNETASLTSAACTGSSTSSNATTSTYSAAARGSSVSLTPGVSPSCATSARST